MNDARITRVSSILANGVMYIVYDDFGNRFFINNLDDYYRLTGGEIPPMNYDNTYIESAGRGYL